MAARNNRNSFCMGAVFAAVIIASWPLVIAYWITGDLSAAWDDGQLDTPASSYRQLRSYLLTT